MNEETQQILPIDYPSAMERIGNDESFLKELLELYVMDFGDKQEKLKAALERMDFTSIQEIGHSLKGSSANLSLIFLQKASFEMEAAGKEEDIERAKMAQDELIKEFQNLKSHLALKY